MPDYSELMRKAREDTECAVEVWATILPEFLGSRLDCVYAKGSALKPWDSHIDYVPILSDVDIHIGLKDDAALFVGSSEDFDAAMDLSAQCEDEFVQRRPDYLHIPRMQVIETRFLKQSDKYTPPRLKDIRILYGTPILAEPPSPEAIRQSDLERVLEDEEFVDDLPRRILDRTGLDFWAIIRAMVWRVAPAPVRILTQINDDPLDVWSWNRSKIYEELIAAGYDSLAKHYHGFYTSGWQLYLSNFQGLHEYRDTVKHGYYVLYECLREVHRISET
ncbi:MAG: hypothetical protein ACFFCP_05295 [Promethearchaeota archaeon]